MPNAVRIFGARYEPSGDVLLVLSPYLLLAGAAPLLSLAATYAGAGRLVVVASCAALAVNAAIDVALLRAHGILVAAVATDVAFALFVILLLRGCAATFGFGFGRAAAGGARLLVALVPALVVLGGLLALGPVAAAAGLLPALGLYLGGLHLTGLLPPQLGTAWRRPAADCRSWRPMALTYHDVRPLLRARYASPPSRPLQEVVTIGRQVLALHPREVRALAAEFGPGVLGSWADTPYGAYADAFLREAVGVVHLDVLDASDYEGATVLHDLNRPLRPR